MAQEISDSGDGRGEVERAPPPLPYTHTHTRAHTDADTCAHTHAHRAGSSASRCQLCVFFNDVTFLRKVASGVITCFKSYMFIIYVLRIFYMYFYHHIFSVPNVKKYSDHKCRRL